MSEASEEWTISQEPEMTIFIFGVVHKRHRLSQLSKLIKEFAVDVLDNLDDVGRVNVYFPADELLNDECSVCIDIRRSHDFWNQDEHWSASSSHSESFIDVFLEPLAKEVHEFVHSDSSRVHKTEVEYTGVQGLRRKYFTIKK